MATTTLAGNSGNNLLNASGLESTLVQGFQGNDTINLALVTDDVQAGKGDDSIRLSKSGTQTNNVQAGEGDDTIRFEGATNYEVTVAAGDGADFIAIGSAATTTLVDNLQIAANQGNDTIDFFTGARTISQSYVGLGQGNDSIRFGTGASFIISDVFGGKGKDTIDVTGLTGASSTVNGGQGSDLLILDAATLTSAKIGAGAGTDSIALGTSTITGSIAGGGLADTISISAIGSGLTIYGDANGITSAGTGTEGSADGADLIGSITADVGGSTVYGAGADDTIRAGTGGQRTILDGGDGNDSLAIGTAYFGDVKGGAGDDNIRVTDGTYVIGAGTVASINGGSGNDSITFAGTGTVAITGTAGTADTNLFIEGAASGDKIIFTNDAITSSASYTNWLSGGGGRIYVFSAATVTLSAVAAAAAGGSITAGGVGSIGVWSDGDDTYFTILGNTGDAATTAFVANRFVLEGTDLVLTTKVGTNVNFTAANFGFTVAQQNTTADTGVVITIS